ncbi:MAG: hypothetical protein GY781_13740 [Gammaproteobacteria bacterium]|nr:hypothetical protein [Gammaproteobacteria bacterium]
MPIKTKSDVTGFIQHLPEVEPEVAQTYGVGEVIQAAFENENSFVSWAANGFSTGKGFEPEKGYDFYNDIRGYEDFADSFIDSESPQQTAYIKTQIDHELENKNVLNAAGAGGVVAQMAGALTDPLFLPFLFVKPVSAGMSARNAFAAEVAVGGAAEAIAEGVKHQTQQTRTFTESAFNVGGAALFSGVIGAGAASLSNKQFKEMNKKMDEVLADPSPRSVGAAEVTDISDDSLEIIGQGIVSKAAVSPNVRMATAPSRTSRLIANQMMESSLVIKGAKSGETAIPTGGSVETRIKLWDSNLAQGIDSVDSAYMKYRGRRDSTTNKATLAIGDMLGGRGEMLKPKDFRIEVGKAMRRGDVHRIPEVQEAAQSMRKQLFDPMKKEAIDEGLLPPGVDVSTADSYLTRMYNHQKIKARRPEWDGIVEDWFKRIRQRAIDESDARVAQGKKVPQSMKAEAATTDMEIKAAVNNITQNILGNNVGRGGYDIKVTVKGPLKERVLNIPDSLIEDFLESDIDLVARQYKMTMAPDIELTRLYGDMEMEAERKAIFDDYKPKIEAAKTEKQRVKLQKQAENNVRDMEAVRDRLRGTYRMPDDPDAFFVRAGRNLRDINFVRMLGGMTISAIPDMARPVAVNGLRPVGRGLKALATSPKKFKMAKAEAKRMGVGLDMVLNSRATTLADVADFYQRGTVFEKGLKSVSDQFSKVALMSQWNAATKQFAGVVTQDRILDATSKWAAGKASKSVIKRLAASGIDENMATRIANQFKQYGDDGDLLLSNGHLWDDTDALQTFQAAVLRDVDRTILTPGVGEKPLWTSSEVGKTVFQFKTFAATAHHKILVADLQYADAAALNGFLMSVALGTLTYGLKQWTSGREVETDPDKLIVESLDRSGAFGYLWDVNNTVEKLTRGTVGVNAMVGAPPMSRYVSRNLAGSLLGPTLGTVQDITDVAGAASTGEFSEKELHKIRKLLPAQNLFYMRRLLDELEEKVQ